MSAVSLACFAVWYMVVWVLHQPMRILHASAHMAPSSVQHPCAASHLAAICYRHRLSSLSSGLQAKCYTLKCIQGDEQFFPASSSALPDEAVPPEVQALTSKPLYNPVAASEASATSMTLPHDLAANASTSQGSSRANSGPQGAQASRRWPWQWGL